MHATPSPVHIDYYLKIVLKHWLARQLIAECSQSIGDAFNPATEPNQALANLSGRLQELAGRITSQQAHYFLSHENSLEYIWRFDQTAEELKAKAASELPSLRFGWEAFDGRDWTTPPTLCLLPATLTTLLARTGGGKTIAAMQIADANALAGLNVLYFHVELNQQQMLARRYCRLTGIPVLAQLRNQIGQSDRRELVQAATQIASWPGRVDFVHCPNWSGERLVQELKARHYALIASHGRGYDLIVLDYLQRLGRSEQNSRAPEHEALAANVRLFSDTLNELNIAGLMTSQVGRSESHQYDPPDLDEGLGTGDIERCSNQLLSLAISEGKDKVKFVIRKNTFGEVGGSGELLYDPRRLQFTSTKRG
jgi:replicative DNA helicase